MDAGYAYAAVCAAALLLHILTSLLAWRRCRRRDEHVTPAPDMPPVSIIRPLKGVDAFETATLGSTFKLDYPRYEVLLCVADAGDPVVALARTLIAKHPHVPARLLIGDALRSPNPKLNNVVKGWTAAEHQWIIMADSNVLLPTDYVQRLLQAWKPGTGLVCAPPIGGRPDGFWAEVECVFLNSYQARWQYAADSVGHGFAQGKSMLWRRDDLDRAGGIAALAAEIAEDAAATKLVRASGKSVRLADRPFEQPLGRRSLIEIWSRQRRWAQLRRHSFPFYFLPEVLTSGVFPLTMGVLAAVELDLDILGVASAIAAIWVASEALLCRAAGWHWSWRSPLAVACRDLLLPVVWLAGWTGRSYSWRGNDVLVDVGASTTVHSDGAHNTAA